MSGLAAILAYDGTPSADAVRRMLDAAPHRGTTRLVEVAGEVVSFLAITTMDEITRKS